MNDCAQGRVWSGDAPEQGGKDQSAPKGATEAEALAEKRKLAAAGTDCYQIQQVMLPGFSRLLTYQVFGVTQGSHLGDSLEFLFYDTPKVLMLLTLVVFGVGIIRTFFTPERTRKVLAGKRESAGNVMKLIHHFNILLEILIL